MNVAHLAVHNVDSFGSYDATWFEDQPIANTLTLSSAARMATVLRERGVKSGDRVVVMMMNCPELLASIQAVWRIGAVVVPVMPQLTAREVGYIIADAGAAVVITVPPFLPIVTEATSAIAECNLVLTFGAAETADAVDIEAAVASADETLTIEPKEERDLAALVYTSGTTGHPKGVMLSHGGLAANVDTVAELIRQAPRARWLMSLPLSHVYGLLMMLLQLRTGSVQVLLKWFETEAALQAIEKHNIERASLVPTMLILLLNHPDRKKYCIDSLEYVTSGSAPLLEEVRVAFEREFGCRVVEGYGQSESTCVISAYADNESVVTGSVGRAIPGMEVCIMNDACDPLDADCTGEICVRGSGVMLGYWGNEQATRETIVEGWLHTGDVGHVNRDGYLFITDRKKDLVIKGGENIAPREIEEVLCRLPAVAEVAVFGVPDDEFQEEIAAAVVLKTGHSATGNELAAEARPHLTKFKLPRHWMFVEALPKNSVGKVLKRQLRESWRPSQRS